MKHHHRTLTVFLAVCSACASILSAQSLPSSFNYQGRLTDTAGTPMPNGNYQMVFSIWDAVTGGNQLWGSGNKTIALNKGLFATSLGPITSAALPAANTFLQVQLGTDTPMPRIALGAVPYALKAVELLWPAVASISNANPVLSLTNTGDGPAIAAVNTGMGSAGTFTINNTRNSTSALVANTNGSGNAVYGTTSGEGHGVYGTTSSIGSGVYGLATAGGNAGRFETTGTNDRTTLVVQNKSVGGAAYFNSVGGADNTLTSLTTGNGSAGVFNIAKTTSTSPSLIAQTTGSGPAIKATPGSGVAGLFEGVIQTNGFKMATGAANGHILTTDANGTGIWKAPSSKFTDLSATGTISTLNLNIDPGNTNTGTLTVGGIRFGSSSGEGLFSKRDAGGNRYGLDLATNFTPRLSITQSGNVGIGISPSQYKLHVQGAKTGNYATPLSYIENTNSTGDSAPALRLGGSSNSPDGVLNISNFGTGKVAVFGNKVGEVGHIDVDGNMAMAGNLSAKNLPAVAFSNHKDDIYWNHGDVKSLETLSVKAPSNGYFVLDGSVNIWVSLSSASGFAMYYLTLYDATNSSKIDLETTAYSFGLTTTDTRISNQVTQFVNWVYPVTKGQSVTFQLEGMLSNTTNTLSFHHNSSSLRVLFVPNALGQ